MSNNKRSVHYPQQFAKVGPKTIRLGAWDAELPTPANANSFRTKWYNYVSCLLRENDVDAWGFAVRVLVTVNGNTVHFEDRENNALTKSMDDWFKDEPVDPVTDAFNRMMEERGKP